MLLSYEELIEKLPRFLGSLEEKQRPCVWQLYEFVSGGLQISCHLSLFTLHLTPILRPFVKAYLPSVTS
jgi:hypothetical protein